MSVTSPAAMPALRVAPQPRTGIAASARMSALKEKAEYRLYMALIFPFSLLAVFLRSLTRVMVTGRSVNGRSRGLVGQAIELTQTTIPWIFMVR